VNFTSIISIISIRRHARYTRLGMPIVDVNISAGKEAVSSPWITTLCRDFNVLVRIVKANVDTDFGWLHLQLEGPVEEIQRATAWLMTTGMHVEALQRAVGVS
jgi:ABC-type methionine transport system ATPase subunit